MNDEDYEELGSLGGAGLRFISLANMVDKNCIRSLKNAIEELEEEGRNGYYDDEEGCMLLAGYLRDKLELITREPVDWKIGSTEDVGD